MDRIEKWSLLALCRFLLAMIVAVGHLSEYTSPGMLGLVSKFGAFEAILGFLLISGYSIAESYSKSPEGFYLRRLKRIYPVYLAAILVTFVAQPPEVSLKFFTILLFNLVFLNQLLTSTSIVGPAWSLSLEVWLYASAPYLKRQSELKLLLLAVTSIGLYSIHTAGRSLLGWDYYSGLGYGLNFPLLAFMWILGFLLSVSSDKMKTMMIIGAGLGYHILLTTTIQFGYRLKNETLALFPEDLVGLLFRLATLVFIWLAFYLFLRKSGGAGVKSPIMRFLGDISYPLYLIHIPVYVILGRFGFSNPYAMFSVACSASALLYLVFDRYSQKREKKST